MSETTPDPADVHTGTDRVELTEEEREALLDALVMTQLSDYAGTDLATVKRAAEQLEPAVESIVAARVQALTAERDELQAILDGRPKNMSEFIHLLDQSVVLPPATIDVARAEAERHRLAREDYWEQLTAARAELTAATAQLRAREDDVDRLIDERDAANARCAELEEEVMAHQVSDGYTKGYEHGTLTTTKFKAERDALQATLDRVTALADEWDRTQIIGNNTYADELRAALTPEGTE